MIRVTLAMIEFGNISNMYTTSQITTRAVLPMTVHGVIYPIRNVSIQLNEQMIVAYHCLCLQRDIQLQY